jgi:hypothetical protein
MVPMNPQEKSYISTADVRLPPEIILTSLSMSSGLPVDEGGEISPTAAPLAPQAPGPVGKVVNLGRHRILGDQLVVLAGVGGAPFLLAAGDPTFLPEREVRRRWELLHVEGGGSNLVTLWFDGYEVVIQKEPIRFILMGRIGDPLV